MMNAGISLYIIRLDAGITNVVRLARHLTTTFHQELIAGLEELKCLLTEADSTRLQNTSGYITPRESIGILIGLNPSASQN